MGKQGVKRVILAREVTLEEIIEIKKQVPKVELEYFVHGAMCMSYSGRCILSKWMASRSANLGDCAQPCRWRYKIRNQESRMVKGEEKKMEVVDDKGRFEIELQEDRNGTYFFNSKDLCLVEHLKDLMGAGVDSLKIEGRAKSVYYVALVVRAYRKVLTAIADESLSRDELNKVITNQKSELLKLSSRGYTKGFLFGNESEHLFDKAAVEAEWSFIGISDEEVCSAVRTVFVHNKIQTGDEVEIIVPERNKNVKILAISDEDCSKLKSAHGGQGKKFQIKFSKEIDGTFLLRKKI